MYNPSPFNIDDEQTLIAFCRKISFGTLVSGDASRAPIVGYVPFVLKEIEGEIVLEFHLALQNELTSKLINGAYIGISVVGEHGYISSSVYHHVNVPTYNYEAIYLTGKCSVLDQFDFPLHLAELVDTFEKERIEPLSYIDFPAEMISAYKKEIIGIRVKIETIKGAFKLSQNRNQLDFDSIIADLDQTDQSNLSQTMKKHYSKND